jgi:hypothetical protein
MGQTLLAMIVCPSRHYLNLFFFVFDLSSCVSSSSVISSLYSYTVSLSYYFNCLESSTYYKTWSVIGYTTLNTASYYWLMYYNAWFADTWRWRPMYGGRSSFRANFMETVRVLLIEIKKVLGDKSFQLFFRRWAHFFDFVSDFLNYFTYLVCKVLFKDKTLLSLLF